MKWNKEKYNNLKYIYFRYLENERTKNLTKGDIRAYIGLKAWIYENIEHEKNGDTISSHLIAFEKALNDFSAAKKKGKIHAELKKSIKIWIKKGRYIQRSKTSKPLLPPPIPKMRKWKKNGFTLISLFSGALGLDLGFLAAGFDLKLTNDIDKNSLNTIHKNLPDVPVILDDISNVTSIEILDKANLKLGEVDVLTGGPPCQPFSTAGKRRGLNDPRASPLNEFVRIIKEIKPKAFVMEEVKGLLSSRLKHVPISERKGRKLSPEEEKGSLFKVVLKMLKDTGYEIIFDVLNAANYGAPQVRDRLIIIGLREGTPVLPEKTHSSIPQKNFSLEPLKPWNTFWESTIDLCSEVDQIDVQFTPRIKKYLPYIPPGGYWKYLPLDLVEEAMGGAYESGGGKKGFFRRLSWDEPSPTVVTSPTQKGSIFCHPESLRPLNINEYKRIQGFPDDWEIVGSDSVQYKLIGNAVPVQLSYAIAQKVKKLLSENNV